MRLLVILALFAAVISVPGCGPPGPSIKQQADEHAATKKAQKQEEDFARSLPPTQSKPVYKP
ncbi:MAG: hypothetical protein ACJ8KU_03530 [Chthoniobacterales bacterium]